MTKPAWLMLNRLVQSQIPPLRRSSAPSTDNSSMVPMAKATVTDKAVMVML